MFINNYDNGFEKYDGYGDLDILIININPSKFIIC